MVIREEDGQYQPQVNLQKIGEKDGYPLWSIVFKGPLGEKEEGPVAIPLTSLRAYFDPSLLEEIAQEVGSTPQDLEGALREAINDARTIHYVESENGIVRVIESDGLVLPLSGGSLRLPDGSLAVVETITAWALREIPDNKGKQREVEGISPFWYVSTVKDGKVVQRGSYFPLDRRVRLGPLSVKVEIQSRPQFNLETLMSAETGKRFLDDAVARPFPEIAEELAERIKDYVVFEDQRVYSVVGSYIILSYLYDIAGVPVARLFFLGPFGSGKTRAMLTTTYASHRGWAALNPSDASTFRMISALRPTLGIDEKVGGEGALLVLKAGYKKGEKVPRVEKTSSDTFVLSAFETYGPVIMAYTSPPREDLAQRTIIIIMVKANPKMNRDPTPFDFRDLREELYLARLTRAAEFLQALDEVGREVGDEIKGRDFELWAGILAAARLMGEEHYRAVLEYAREDIQGRMAEAYTEERLILSVLAGIMGDDGVARATTSVIFGELKTRLMGEGYSERTVEREWSLKKLGNLLRRLGFRRRTMKVGGSYPKLYVITKEELLDIAKRYGIEDAVKETLPGSILASEGEETEEDVDRFLGGKGGNVDRSRGGKEGGQNPREEGDQKEEEIKDKGQGKERSLDEDNAALSKKVSTLSTVSTSTEVEGKEGDRRLDGLDTLDGLSEKEGSEKGDESGRSGPEKTDTGSLEKAPLSNNLSNPSNPSNVTLLKKPAMQIQGRRKDPIQYAQLYCPPSPHGGCELYDGSTGYVCKLCGCGPYTLEGLKRHLDLLGWDPEEHIRNYEKAKRYEKELEREIMEKGGEIPGSPLDQDPPDTDLLNLGGEEEGEG